MRQREKPERAGPGEEKKEWAGSATLGRGREKKKGEGERRDGLGRNKREGKRVGFPFLNLIQTLQSKFKFNEFKFKLNNKQLNDAKQHECNKTTSFNF